MQYKIELQPSGVIYGSSNNILDDAIEQGIVLEHSCKTGSCGVCRAEIVSGEVENLDGEVVSSGEVLTCCSKAKTNLILIANYYPELSNIKEQTVPCKVSSYKYATDDILVVHFRFPPSVKLKYLPGQYVDLTFKGIVRSYSIANFISDHNEVELHIRRVPEGRMSNVLFNDLKENQLMRITGPKGTFFVREDNLPLILIATGTGIAPIKAIVEKLISSQDKREISIYWGMRYKNEIYCNELEKLSLQFDNIEFLPVLSRESDWLGHKGYVQDAVLRDFSSLENVAVYACGSSNMIEQAKALFYKHKLPSEQFYSDAFTPAK